MTPVPVFIALDDATPAVDAERDRLAPGGVSTLAEDRHMNRSSEIGGIWASHGLSTSEHIRADTENFIVCRAQGESLSHLRQLLGTNAEQSSQLRALGIGQAVGYFPASWPLPVLGQYIYLESVVDLNLLQTREAEFLQRISSRKGGSKKAVQTGIPPEMLRLLLTARLNPVQGVTTLYVQAGLDPTIGRKALEWLHAEGLAIPVNVSASRRGGRLRILEVTSKGVQELEQRGFQFPPMPTRGKFLHKCTAVAIRMLCRARRESVQFERRIANVAADVVATSENGILTCYQIGLSDPDWEIGNIKKLLTAEGLATIHLVARDAKFSKQLADKLSTSGLTNEELNRISMTCVGDLLLQVQGLDDNNQSKANP